MKIFKTRRSKDGRLLILIIFKAKILAVMQQNVSSCIKRVGGLKICSYCNGKLVVHRKSNSGSMRYKCKDCSKTRVECYAYQAYNKKLNQYIIQLLKEGVGIRSTARLLNISATTVMKRLSQMAKNLRFPIIKKGGTYEVDEIRTFVKREDGLIWIVYSLLFLVFVLIAVLTFSTQDPQQRPAEQTK